MAYIDVWRQTNSEMMGGPFGYSGPAGQILIELKGFPGLSGPIRTAVETWANLNGVQMMDFRLEQDTAPFFDKYRVSILFHDSPIAWAVIIPALLIAFALLALGIVTYKTVEVIWNPSNQRANVVATIGEAFAKQIEGASPEEIPAIVEAYKDALAATSEAAPSTGGPLGDITGLLAGAGGIVLLIIVLVMFSGRGKGGS